MAEASKSKNEAIGMKNKTSGTANKTDTKTIAAAETKVTETEPKKVDEKQPEVKKAEAKQAEPKRSSSARKSAKKGAKRGPKPVSERTVELKVEFDDKEAITYTNLVNNVKEWWKSQGKREISLKSINIYVKPEDVMAYCIVNDKIEYNIDLSDWN